jgi:hypothetical protein
MKPSVPRTRTYLTINELHWLANVAQGQLKARAKHALAKALAMESDFVATMFNSGVGQTAPEVMLEVERFFRRVSHERANV